MRMSYCLFKDCPVTGIKGGGSGDLVAVKPPPGIVNANQDRDPSGIQVKTVFLPASFKVSDAVSANSSVEKILYPEIPDHPDHLLARKLLPKGCGAVFSFDIKGGREAGRKFIEALRVFSHLANVGDAKSLVIHPATTTHYRMSDEDLKKAGIGPGTVRLSIGLEDVEDLMQDLERALALAVRVK